MAHLRVLRDPADGSDGSPDPRDSVDDTELMQCVASGDPAAFDVLISRYWEALVRFAATYSGDVDVAEDVAQGTFVSVWERRADWRPTGSVASYLYSIARNISLNLKRRRTTHVDSIEALRRRSERRSIPTPLQNVQAGELRQMVERAIEELPSRRREVFRLSRFEGLSYAEIAEVLEISAQTVANHMSAALSNLREALAPVLRDGTGTSNPVGR